MGEKVQVIKRPFKNELLLYPCPILLVTSLLGNVRNVLTVSWTGIASSHPEYITISINKKRFSHSLIINSGAFIANIIDEDLLFAADYCGTYSGREVDKFEHCRFNISNGKIVDAPLIDDCPINIECIVEKTIDLGSHDLIIGKVVAKWISNNIDDSAPHKKLHPVTYFRPYYYNLNTNILGKYGKTHSRLERDPD